MRLIDADRLKSYIDCGHLRPPTEVCFSELDVCSMIDKAPTVTDAVSLTGTMKYLTKPHNYCEVVRCKDCEYKSDWDGVYNHDTELFCYLHECGMDNNDFCSKAKLKGGAE